MNTVNCCGRKISPSKIICIGRNYVAHIEELDNDVPEQPVVFLKPNSSLSHTLVAEEHGSIHYETELCFVIQGNQLAAVGVGLDLTKRNLQANLKEKGLPWERAKAFDGAALFSEFIALNGNLSNLGVELRVNSQLRQAGGMELMLYSPQALLDDVQTFMSVNDGDILMTGTPAGVGPVFVGDEFQARVLQSGKVLVEAQWVAQKKK